MTEPARPDIGRSLLDSFHRPIFGKQRWIIQHFLASHPFPDPTPWSQIDDPWARLRVALGALYAYYRATEVMTVNILCNAPLLPALDELIQDMPRYFIAVRAMLSHGWKIRDDDRSLVEATIGHALEFETWRSLTRRHALADSQAIEIMIRLVDCFAAQRRRRVSTMRP
jgi:hypothetical protein